MVKDYILDNLAYYENLVKQLRYCANAVTCRKCQWRCECCLPDVQRNAADVIEDLISTIIGDKEVER